MPEFPTVYGEGTEFGPDIAAGIGGGCGAVVPGVPPVQSAPGVKQFELTGVPLHARYGSIRFDGGFVPPPSV